MKRKDNIFTSVMNPPLDTNTFDMSHDKKLTFSMGEIVPVCCMEAIPGDTFHLQYGNLIRFAPLIAPVMHRVRVKTEYFFIPNRLLWSGFTDFITGQSADLAPFLRLNEDPVPVGSNGDYLGIPPGDYSNQPLNINAMQIAALYLVYDEWYRDQNLISEKFIPLTPGNNNASYMDKLTASPLRRAWEHDYFTSALPTSQQGTEVDIPLTFQNDIPVTVIDDTVNVLIRDTPGSTPAEGALSATVTSGTLAAAVTGAAHIDPNGSLGVDVQSDAASINDLREAFALQSFLERSIRGGKRYIEWVRSIFGEKSSDARLQRPEMIGSNVQNVTIGEVLATAQNTGDGIAVGHMAGHGISSGGSDHMSYHCEEHGFIMGFISVIPDTAYQDGLHRQFSRFDRLDYAVPDFAHLGEQEIRNKEIVCHDLGGAFPHEDVFGYIPRYSEYRYHPSSVAGEFRDTLSFWTLGRIFEPIAPPSLNEQFVTCDPSTRIFAVTGENEDHIFAQVLNMHKVTRKLPRYGVPKLIG